MKPINKAFSGVGFFTRMDRNEHFYWNGQPELTLCYGFGALNICYLHKKTYFCGHIDSLPKIYFNQV